MAQGPWLGLALKTLRNMLRTRRQRHTFEAAELGLNAFAWGINFCGLGILLAREKLAPWPEGHKTSQPHHPEGARLMHLLSPFRSKR